MLGGTIVNISGPCFSPFERVVCKFDTESVEGFVIDQNRAICVQPFLFAQGYIRFEVAIGTEAFKWKGRFFVGTFRNQKNRIKLNLFDREWNKFIQITKSSIFFIFLCRNTGHSNRQNIFSW